MKAAFTIALYLLDEMETNAYHGSNVKTSVFWFTNKKTLNWMKESFTALDTILWSGVSKQSHADRYTGHGHYNL